MKAIFGKKLGMTRVFNDEGDSIPVTVIEVGPNVVYQVKTPDVDGYSAVQIGYGQKKVQRVNRPAAGHFAKAEKGMPEYSAEIRFDTIGQVNVNPEKKEFAVGDEITVDGMFSAGERVDVVGRSIGKGFAGVIKRHHMKGAQTMTHGTHEYFRHGGSIGCRKFPGRVFKNKRMPGHMGDERVMQQGVEVVAVRAEENLILIKGSVPGPKNGKVFVRASVKCA